MRRNHLFKPTALYRCRYALLAGIAAGVFAPMAPTAYAQTSANASNENLGELEEVVVVSKRQQYFGKIAPEDMPKSVQILSKDFLTQMGVVDMIGALDLASGVARQNNFGGLWDAFAIRGFSGDINVPSGYLLNGFNSGRGFGGVRDTVSIERMEILKGPQGALFGRGEPGGTVNVVTKKPEFDTAGSVALSGGRFDKYRAEGDYTGTLVEDMVAFRISGAYEDSGSFRDTVTSEKYTVIPSFRVLLGENAMLTYELEIVHQEIPFDRGVVSLNNQLDIIPVSRFLGEPGDGPTVVDAVNHQVELQYDINENWAVLLGLGIRDTEFEGSSQNPELATGRQPLFEDGRTLSRQRRFNFFDTEHLTVRGEVSGQFETAGLTHYMTVGADYEEFDIDRFQSRFRPPSVAAQLAGEFGNTIDIFNPVYGTLADASATTNFDDFEAQEASGVYLHNQIDLTGQLKILLGGRYDDWSQIFTNNSTGNFISEQSVNTFTFQAGLVYQINDSVTLYGNFGEGFRPNSGNDVNLNSFEPEESESYELGVKMDALDGKLNGTLSVYSMTKTNILTADSVNQGFSIAVGGAKSEGVELDINALLPGDIEFRLAYAFIDAGWDTDVLDPNFAFPISKGDRLLNIPEHSGNVQIFRDFRIAGNPLKLGGGVSYVGAQLGETGKEDFELPSYTLVDLFASYKPVEQVELRFQVRNLFDEKYYVSSFFDLWVTPGPPTTYAVTARYTF